MATKADTTGTVINAEAAVKAKAVDKAKRDAAASLVRINQKMFNEMVQEDLAEQGIDWSPRLTPQQRAAEQMATLIQQFPDLANRLVVESA